MSLVQSAVVVKGDVPGSIGSVVRVTDEGQACGSKCGLRDAADFEKRYRGACICRYGKAAKDTDFRETPQRLRSKTEQLASGNLLPHSSHRVITIMLRRILVPVNFTTASARAVAVARDYRPENAVIRLLCVINPSDIATATANPAINPMHARDERNKAEHEAMEKLRAWAREGEEVAVEVGSTAEEISAHADTWGADLIAMGTRGRTGLSQFLHGSATEWLVRHAKQPVLAVHDVELDPEQAKHLPPVE